MKRRDGSLETDRAPEPPGVDRWRGPVATLVDGDTASAAEMIAGALVGVPPRPDGGDDDVRQGMRAGVHRRRRARRASFA